MLYLKCTQDMNKIIKGSQKFILYLLHLKQIQLHILHQMCHY